MKVSQLLTVPNLNGMNIIAGQSGIEREVTSVNMMDAPDIIHYLNKNEFLITTAYHFKDQPHMLTELVEAMAKQSCAGLGIKTKRFLDNIPDEVIQLADQLSLPVIELPLHLSLGEIVNHTLRAILDQRSSELTFALETHKQFTKIIMEGKGIGLLLQDLSRMIQRPVQLIDQHFKSIFHEEPIEKLPLLLDGKTLPPPTTSPTSFSIASTRDTYTIFPIHISERKKGYLLINGEVEKTDHLTSLTIEQATNVISFSLMKDSALKQQDRSIRNDFFLHFLDGTFSSQEEIIGRATEFSLKNEQQYICVVGKIDGDNYLPTYAKRHEQTDFIYDFIEDEVFTMSPKIHFFTKGESCILLFEAEEHMTHPSTCCESILVQLQERVLKYYENTISFGMSNLCHTFLYVKDAYKDALDALSQGNLSKRTGYIQNFQTKDVTELLRTVPQDDLKNFYSFALSRLTNIKIEEEQTLLETLSVYLETHCQISETAKRLFIHRNTVVYRIEKCEEILGKSLKDSETTLQIRIALRIRALLQN
ncbi:PucR family transcriptional regulator [Robertmurraya korlensis]|uniref:PucR family transcriptional regulator n=1 Tax=Robertmurraya korlensis TaxID=519977 RepID=UPI000824C417|nr:PucR family transcriptional regulator [Robertmurraya korlensis]